MKRLFTFSRHPLIAALALAGLGCLPLRGWAQTDATPALLDDFADAKRTARGAERLLIDDKVLGGKSQATQTCAAGVLAVQGDLVPGRGAPAFISLVLLLTPEGQPRDLSKYTGVRLKVKVTKGNVCVQVSTAAVKNMDYHTSVPLTRQGGGFQEVRVPFAEMKRGWSEQTALDRQTVTSVNLVAVGMAAEAFAYEVDEVGFY